MVREEMLEDFKRKINVKVMNNEIASQDVNKVIEECFSKLEEIFQEYGCSSESILEYIQGSRTDMRVTTDKVFENRNGEFLASFNNKINKILEEVMANHKIDKKYDKNLLENLDMDINDAKDTNKIVERLQENLYEIRSHTGRVLSNRGYSESRIEEIMYRVNSLIKNVESRQGEEIFSILNKDGKDTVEEILEEYEKVEREIPDVEDMEKEPADEDKNDFRRSLDGGLSLEEQSENAKRFIDELEETKGKQEKSNEFELRGDVIE